MIYNLMPIWLRAILRMDTAHFNDAVWTWRHTCRYGFLPPAGIPPRAYRSRRFWI